MSVYLFFLIEGRQCFPFYYTMSPLPHSYRNHWLLQDRLFINFKWMLLAFMN